MKDQVFMQIVHAQLELYALNVYLYSYNNKKKYFKPLQQWLIELAVNKPHAIVIVASDFGSCEYPINHFVGLSLHETNTFQRKIKGNFVQSHTDWVLSSRYNFTLKTVHVRSDHSDHCYIKCMAETFNHKHRATHIKISLAKNRIMCQGGAEKLDHRRVLHTPLRRRGYISKRFIFLSN